MTDKHSSAQGGERYDLSFFTTYTDEDGHEIGIPLENIVTAIGVWVSCQPTEPTVMKCMQTFNITEEVVMKAVEEHYWLGMTERGPEALEATLFMDGM